MLCFAFSDIHGMGNCFDRVMKYLDSQTAEYKCFFLGDACDRGPDGYRIMKELLARPDITYIKGNHEDMFVKACHAYIDTAEEEGYTPSEYARMNDWDMSMVLHDFDIDICISNGGLLTLNAWLRDGCPRKILRDIENLPLKAQFVVEDFLGNCVRVIDMCHAGCIEAEWDNDIAEGMLWDRSHFSAPWNPNDDIPHILVHGHTPTRHLSRYVFIPDLPASQRNQPIEYADKTKWDIDVAVFSTNIACMVELTEMKIIKFYPEDI